MSNSLPVALIFLLPCLLGILAVLLDNLLERWGVR